MGDVVLVDSVSMAYRLYRKPSDMLKEAILGGTRHDRFWALRDVSFAVREKQRIGIIGSNGAGKSTLLQIIAGNLQPTAGRVKVDGRISALLSLVPSWSAEDSGIENIRFNLLLQGCAPARLPSIIEEIVDFTELGAFIHQPVRTYSTGMSARLSFAIATALDPEILIIDEVLATGDAYFVGKAHQRMVEFCDRGRAMLFVSHATDAVRRMCDTVVWMQNGSVRLIGPTEYVLRQYEEDYRRSEDESVRSGHRERSESRRGTVDLEDVLGEPLLRLRLIPAGHSHFRRTHYVRAVRIDGLDAQTRDVPLDFADPARQEVHSALDILGSEWGRIHERNGVFCRALVRMTGRKAGGHFLAKPPGGIAAGASMRVTVEIEVCSPEGDEPLVVEALDVGAGAWVAFDAELAPADTPGWSRLTARGTLGVPRPEDIHRLRETLVIEEGPAVEIVETRLLGPDGALQAATEGQPFSVGIRVRANRTVAVADVSLKLVRSDGVYAFWQSSGMSGVNLCDFTGEREVVFRFDPNCFGAGTYLVSAYAANGWDLERNYPYSEVYCRAIDVLKLEIRPADSRLDLGIVNIIAGVELQ
jgi:lipopolysaccharide transport system ATP-binding protein